MYRHLDKIFSVLVCAAFHRKHFHVTIMTNVPPSVAYRFKETKNAPSWHRKSHFFRIFIKNVSVVVRTDAGILLILKCECAVSNNVLVTSRHSCCYSVTRRLKRLYRQHNIGLWRRPLDFCVTIGFLAWQSDFGVLNIHIHTFS